MHNKRENRAVIKHNKRENKAGIKEKKDKQGVKNCNRIKFKQY